MTSIFHYRLHFPHLAKYRNIAHFKRLTFNLHLYAFPCSAYHFPRCPHCTGNTIHPGSSSNKTPPSAATATRWIWASVPYPSTCPPASRKPVTPPVWNGHGATCNGTEVWNTTITISVPCSSKSPVRSSKTKHPNSSKMPTKPMPTFRPTFPSAPPGRYSED